MRVKKVFLFLIDLSNSNDNNVLGYCSKYVSEMNSSRP